ncbi:histone-like nucleoid-structuring protein Lsr2 [Corynebacterium kozikiae]|uniref:histone-like nucleoid-structuring protein Lsr2 n=1 Tax=Corynebacterium kozikiae TaxID=2968469 RepID=UPI00211C969E|nr:Lsr2 family protein [Corynebacterium sp. 76QC2CO]MCQ9343044.1 Lsr2 family protein [Corynebacterium sp. 76QC2CO]
MARREITQYFDDLDNTPLTEEEVHIVNFTVNGVEYVMDLSAKNAEKFLEVLEPYLSSARKLSTGRRPAFSPKYDPKAVRVWAKGMGYEVSTRGKIPQHIIDEYLQAGA